MTEISHVKVLTPTSQETETGMTFETRFVDQDGQQLLVVEGHALGLCQSQRIEILGKWMTVRNVKTQIAFDKTVNTVTLW